MRKFVICSSILIGVFLSGCYEGKIDIENAIKYEKIRSVAQEELNRLNHNGKEQNIKDFAITREGEKWLVAFHNLPFTVNGILYTNRNTEPVRVYLIVNDNVLLLGVRAPPD